MAALLLDTHALLWHMNASPRLSVRARAAIEAALRAAEPIFVSAISVAEIAYLVDKRRVPPDTQDRVVQFVGQPANGLHAVPMDWAMAQSLRHVPIGIVADMPDRMLAATALHLNVPLITADRHILASPVPTIW